MIIITILNNVGTHQTAINRSVCSELCSLAGNCGTATTTLFLSGVSSSSLWLLFIQACWQQLHECFLCVVYVKDRREGNIWSCCAPHRSFYLFSFSSQIIQGRESAHHRSPSQTPSGPVSVHPQKTHPFPTPRPLLSPRQCKLPFSSLRVPATHRRHRRTTPRWSCHGFAQRPTCPRCSTSPPWTITTTTTTTITTTTPVPSTFISTTWMWWTCRCTTGHRTATTDASNAVAWILLWPGVPLHTHSCTLTTVFQ